MIYCFLNYLFDNVLAYNFNCILFLIFNLIVLNLILSIFIQNPVHSILFLILAFINLSFSLFMLGLSFLPFMLLLIYAGAISILLIFVLMILNIKLVILQEELFFYVPIIVLSFIFIFEIIFFGMFNTKFITYPVFIYIDWIKIFYAQDEIFALGLFIFNRNVSFMFLISLILLIALIGSITLVIERKTYIKKQKVNEQLLSQLFNLRLFKKE